MSYHFALANSDSNVLSRVRAALGSRYAREPLLMVAAYLVYYVARNYAADAQPAFENARYLMVLEATFGIFEEISIQSALISYDAIVHLFNIIYYFMHWPLIVTFGLYLFIARPHVYTVARNAFLISGAVGLLFFVLFPVAPPRLATFGIEDTLAMTLPIDYDESPLVNPYAALPSLHVGWALLISLGIFLATKQRLMRFLAILITPAMFFATVITGNHFFIDGILGIVLAGTAFLLALWLQRNWPAIEADIRTKLRRLRTSPQTT